jgi:NhaC family Na+:H+ antiporter
MSSIATTVIIIAIACSYTGIMDGTGWIVPIQNRIDRLADRIGLFPSMLLITLCSAAIFCNQIIGIMMSHDLLAKSYEQRGRSPEELAIDIENCAITLPALVPWCILITVPLAILGVGHLAVLYGVYIYAVPLITLIGKGLKRKESK